MQVSDMEKNPETASSAASATKSQRIGTESVTGSPLAALQDQLEHGLAAHVREHERGEPGERPVHRGAPAPAPEEVPREESPEDEPREDREDVLVGEREGLAEELLGEEHPGEH